MHKLNISNTRPMFGDSWLNRCTRNPVSGELTTFWDALIYVHISVVHQAVTATRTGMQSSLTLSGWWWVLVDHYILTLARSSALNSITPEYSARTADNEPANDWAMATRHDSMRWTNLDWRRSSPLLTDQSVNEITLFCTIAAGSTHIGSQRLTKKNIFF